VLTSESIYVYGGRPWSVFREPDWFGGYLTFIIGLTFPFAYSKYNSIKKYRTNKLILYLAILMSLIIVVRSSWLGLIVGILLALIVISKKLKIITLSSITKIAIILCVCLILVFSLSLTHYESIQDRFTSIFTYVQHKQYDPAAQVRLNSYEIILNYIKQRPLQGYGAGAWEFLSKWHQYINPSLSANTILLTPIFEMGISGVILYLIFVFALLKMIYNGIRHASADIENRYAIGIMIAVAGTLVVSIFNDIMLTGFYWAFIAIFNNYIDALKKNNEDITYS
jgi:O-antigen ligase